MNRRFHSFGRPTLLGLSLIVVSVVGCQALFNAFDDGDGGDFLVTGNTQSFFTAFQVDPRAEDSAGPQFVAAEDLDGDGMIDLVSAWNQSQPVQIHLQRRSATGAVTFETVTLAGSVPAVAVAGLAIADFDGDNRQDIAVLVKESLLEGAACLDSEQPGAGLRGLILIYLGPSDPAETTQALAWEEVRVGASFLQGTGSAGGAPEEGGFTSMVVGDVDNNGTPDLTVAWNSNCNENTVAVVVFSNGGSGDVRDGSWTGMTIPDPFPKGTTIKDVALADIDRDGDLDIVATYPTAETMNVRWYRNPTVDTPDDFHISDGGWQVGLVAQIATGADVIRLADVDQDGIVDVLVRSSGGRLIQWLKGPEGATTAPLRSSPWQVFTIAEFKDRTPTAFALGDLNFDGQIEVLAAAGGGLIWLDPIAAPSVFDQWSENLIIDDELGGLTSNTPATTDPNVAPVEVGGGTLINSIIVVDIDGDGANDVVATLDRSGLSGLTNDALAWFRNTLPPPQ